MFYMEETLDELYLAALQELTDRDQEIIAYWNHLMDPSPLSKELFSEARQLVDGLTFSIVLEWIRQHREAARGRGADKAAKLFDQLWRRNVEAMGGDPDVFDEDHDSYFDDSIVA